MKTEGFKLATEEEAKEALINEAKKNNLTPKNIKNINCLLGFSKDKNQEYYNVIGNYYYEAEYNKLWIQDGSYLDICVYDNGKFATIISNPIEEKIKEIEANIENVVKEAKKQLDELKKQIDELKKQI